MVSSGFPLLDDAAQQGIARCVFKPATFDGQAVERWMKMQYVWTLEPHSAGPAAGDAALAAAAARGEAAAQLEMGHRADAGQGMPQSPQEAARWYRLAAEQGNAAAQNSLGAMLEKGIDIPQNLAEAAELVPQGGGAGHGGGGEQPGRAVFFGARRGAGFAQAAAWYRKAAAHGNAASQTNLAALYASGRGVERSDVEANQWLRKAAEGGHAPAQVMLGNRTMRARRRTQPGRSGRLVPQGGRAGRRDGAQQPWLQLRNRSRRGAGLRAGAVAVPLAAGQGNGYAQEALGGLYESGHGVAADMPTALSWYLMAAGQRNPVALRKLGILYEAGRGVEKSPQIAFSYFDMASAVGDEKAMRRLVAVYTEGGLDVAPNAILAKQWQERADRIQANSGAAAKR